MLKKGKTIMTPSLIPEIQVKLYMITAVIGFLFWFLAKRPNTKKLVLLGTMFATVINYPISLLLYLIMSTVTSLYASIVKAVSVRSIAFVTVYIFIFNLLYKLWRRK